MFGLLNLLKPAGVTSRDVVNTVQRLVRPDKVGHAGTLDPLATGVLLVCIGPATRLVDSLHDLRKSYAATFLLGRSSESADIDELVTERPELPVPTREALDAALPQFVGRILQTPPVYSAVKLDGRRAYARARRGETVELQPRPIDVHTLEITRFEFPILELAITCGSGCYVRSLGRDLARAVGSDAVMSQLERTAIGPFVVHDAIRPENLRRDNLEAYLHSAVEALPGYPRRVCDEADLSRLRHGLALDAGNVAPTANAMAAAVDAAGQLAALVVATENGTWQPTRVFLDGCH